MKKLFYVLLVGVTVLLAVPFVYLNQQQVVLNYYMGLHWQGQLPVLLAITLIFGVLLGYLFSVWSAFRLRGKLFEARRALKKAQAIAEQTAS